LILSYLFVQIRSRVWFVVLSFFFKQQIWRLRKGTTSVGEKLQEDDRHIWVYGRRCVQVGLGLVSARRLQWKPAGADEGRSVVVDDEGRDGDLWTARSLVRTVLLWLTMRTVLRGE
jgi:hypothetical protein